MSVNVNLTEQNVIRIIGGIMINVDVNKFIYVKKDYVWNPATCNCENGKHLGSIMDDSTIICDEVIESYDEEIKYQNKIQRNKGNTIPTNFTEKKVTCEIQSFYILLTFLLITIAFLDNKCKTNVY